ncbi:hypothetical protein [Nocardia wallacei]|uniref:hypothetical protein n=1 Tax=Nocardia wallacei TaxID=480035 RepID=UPI002454AA65|nr:hypothetical protein [Nocardia wallacei]
MHRCLCDLDKGAQAHESALDGRHRFVQCRGGALAELLGGAGLECRVDLGELLLHLLADVEVVADRCLHLIDDASLGGV